MSLQQLHKNYGLINHAKRLPQLKDFDDKYLQLFKEQHIILVEA